MFFTQTDIQGEIIFDRNAITAEHHLVTTLFNDSSPTGGYDARQRPVNASHPGPVQVTLTLSVTALQGVVSRVKWCIRSAAAVH